MLQNHRIFLFKHLWLFFTFLLLYGQSDTTIEDTISLNTINVDTTETLTYIDEKTIRTIKIGEQVWMVENLRVTNYKNNDEIPNITDNGEWVGLQIGAYCNYDNDEIYGETYGLLYNWYAVNDSRGLAPEGWHIPTDDEWKELEIYLGLSQKEAYNTSWRGTDQGGKLKEVGYEHWNTCNTGATNESGFTALPCGARNYEYGSCFDMGISSYFWSFTGSNSYNASARKLYCYYSGVRRYSYNKNNGFSVRCVKDD